MENKQLAIMYLISLLPGPAILIFLLIEDAKGNTEGGIVSKVITLSMLVGVSISLVLFYLSITPRWSRVLTFTETSFTCSCLFRKKITVPYEKVYIDLAEYFHASPSGLGSHVYFIVISTRRLSRWEKEHINELQINNEIFAIAYRKKKAQKISKCLNGKTKRQFDTCMHLIEQLKENRKKNGTQFFA